MSTALCRCARPPAQPDRCSRSRALPCPGGMGMTPANVPQRRVHNATPCPATALRPSTAAGMHWVLDMSPARSLTSRNIRAGSFTWTCMALFSLCAVWLGASGQCTKKAPEFCGGLVRILGRVWWGAVVNGQFPAPGWVRGREAVGGAGVQRVALNVSVKDAWAAAVASAASHPVS